MNRKVSIKDIAREAGVSIATVSYVINGVNKVNDNTRDRVKKIIDDMGYQPNINARNLVKKESTIIGIIVPIGEKDKDTILLDNPYYLQFLSVAENNARLNGYSTMILSIDEEEMLTRYLKSGTLAGIIVIGYAGQAIYDILEEVDRPVVVVDQTKTSDKFYYVMTNDEEGAFMATNYLIEKGHKKVCFITGEKEDTPVVKYRMNGYRMALKKNGIPFDESLVIRSDISYEGGISVAQEIINIDKKITGIFAISDIVSMGIIRGFYDMGINIPEDKSVIGFDNIINSKYYIPQLTTVDQHISKKAETSVNIIMKICENKNQCSELHDKVVKISVDLIERESVKAI